MMFGEITLWLRAVCNDGYQWGMVDSRVSVASGVLDLGCWFNVEHSEAR